MNSPILNTLKSVQSWQQNFEEKTKLHQNFFLKTTKINVKTYQFKTQCKGDISHAFETAKITVFDPVTCKTPDAPLQNEMLY